MNLKKPILLLVFFMTSISTFAQESIDAQVKDLTQMVNTRLVEANENLKLSDDQITEINKLHSVFVLEKNKKSKRIKDEKELWKVMYPKIKETNNAIRSLLTKEQLAAYNSYKAK